MTNEFEQVAFAYYRQQRASREALHDALVIAEGQRDQARAERDALRKEWSGLLIEQTRLMALRDEAIAERDALRTEVQQSRLEFQIMQAHAKQDAVQP